MSRHDPQPAHLRVLARVDTTDPDACWLWQGPPSGSGHGQVRSNGRLEMVHRVVWEALVGPIPDEVLHHRETCPKRCVNPAHLTPMSSAAHSTHHSTRDTCSKGHPFDTSDARQRICSICRRDRWRRWKQRQMVAA